MSEETANIWWAREGDPLFLANVNGEETPSLLTFKDGIYQYLCPREGTPYTKIENIREVEIIPLIEETGEGSLIYAEWKVKELIATSRAELQAAILARVEEKLINEWGWTCVCSMDPNSCAGHRVLQAIREVTL